MVKNTLSLDGRGQGEGDQKPLMGSFTIKKGGIKSLPGFNFLAVVLTFDF
jgi:hypothetical protein